MKKYNIGFIGYGNMAQAITSALISEGAKSVLKAFGYKIKIAVSDLDEQKINSAPPEIAAVVDNKALVDACDIIFISVKPQVAKEVLAGLDFSNKIVFSIMASVSLKTLSSFTDNKAKALVRVMPNLNAKIGSSYSTFCLGNDDEEIRKLAVALLCTFGEVKELGEELMNVSTGLSGSGPAFVFKFIKAFYEDAKKNGIPEDTALDMAIATIMGSVAHVATKRDEGDLSLDELVKSVCSKGGTTIQGVNYLDEMNFEDIVGGAIDRAIARAGEMSKDNERD